MCILNASDGIPENEDLEKSMSCLLSFTLLLISFVFYIRISLLFKSYKVDKEQKVASKICKTLQCFLLLGADVSNGLPGNPKEPNLNIRTLGTR